MTLRRKKLARDSKQRTLDEFLSSTRLKLGLETPDVIFNAFYINELTANHVTKMLIDYLRCYELGSSKLNPKTLKRDFRSCFGVSQDIICTPLHVCIPGAHLINEEGLLKILSENMHRYGYNLFSYACNICLENIVRELCKELRSELHLEVEGLSRKNLILRWSYRKYRGRLRLRIRYWRAVEDGLVFVLNSEASVLQNGRYQGLNVIKDRNARKEIRSLLLKFERSLLEHFVQFLSQNYGIKVEVLTSSLLKRKNISLDVPNIRLCFSDISIKFLKESSDDPMDTLKYGPYSLQCDEIHLYVIYRPDGETQKVKEILKDYAKFIEEKIGLSIKYEFVELNYSEPVIPQLKKQHLMGNTMKCCEAGIAVLKGWDAIRYRHFKAASFKPGFYFKYQVIRLDTLTKLAKLKTGDGYPIAASLTNSIVFRAEGTPYLVRSPYEHDVLAEKIAVGIGFSKSPSEKGFTEASIVVLDVYSGHVAVETLQLRGSGGKLGLEEGEITELMNKVKSIIARYEPDYKDVTFYISKQLNRDEIEMFYDKAQGIGAKSVSIVSLVKNPPKILYKNRDTAILLLKLDDHRLAMVQWYAEEQEYPLIAIIHGKDVNEGGFLKKEILAINSLRYLYYPSAKPLLRDIAPTAYAKRVARIAPYIRALGLVS